MYTENIPHIIEPAQFKPMFKYQLYFLIIGMINRTVDANFFQNTF